MATDECAWRARDDADLRDPRLARVALVAGLFALPLAPFVVGGIPAAIAIHAGVSHLKHRLGHRAWAYTGLIAAIVASVLSAFAAIAWAGLLMMVLLTRSALEQARGWEGKPIGDWSFALADGSTLRAADAHGRILFIDVFAPESPTCAYTLPTLAEFGREHPQCTIVSWAPESNERDARAFARTHGVTHPLAFGAQSLPEPLSLVSAKPTLFVVDREGIVRRVVLGNYDASGLIKLLEDAEAAAVSAAP